MKLFERAPRESEVGGLPVVPLKEMVVFPGMVVPFFIGKSAAGVLSENTGDGAQIVLCTQRVPKPEPGPDDFYDVATIASVIQSLRLPDGSTRLLVEGKKRASVRGMSGRGRSMTADVTPIEEAKLQETEEIRALINTVRESYRKLVNNSARKIGPDAQKAVERAADSLSVLNVIAGYSPLPIEKKIELLRNTDQRERLEELAISLEAELETLDLKKRIQGRVRKRLEQSQREHYLNEQRKEIDRELGRGDDDPSGAEEMKKRLEEKKLPDEVRARCEKEIARLARLQPVSPEAGIIRTWLDWIADLPWREYSSEHHDLQQASVILDADHYDMEKPKERILDYLAVHELKPDQRGPILCFVGPPGTGKTSLGASLARSLGREFLRISLGGVRDEAEIRGHRKTYVGALPGKIVQSLRKVNSSNPVFLLDEIDKMSSDFRGDPASALLEVLDPEQNVNFVDHYLEVPFDLSRIIFITTANSIHNVPYALRDRMEIIEIPGYTEQEKTRIAKGFLVPKQLEANGLAFADIRFRDAALATVIRDYTAESGVRELERQIGTIVRKLARRAVSEGVRPPGGARPEEDAERPAVDRSDDAPADAAGSAGTPENGEGTSTATKTTYSAIVTPKVVRKSLGKPRPNRDVVYPEPRSGLARGLAWTELGGTLLPVEATTFRGDGSLILTGSLGEVMKESGRIALSFIRNHSHRFSLDERRIDESDIHLHVPHGAIPKDGPSAGITLTVAMLSALTGIPAHTHIAMTGEITLTGRILPVGGVKEKVLAALRNDIPNVLLPEGNRIDREDLPPEVHRGLELHFVESVMDALSLLFPQSLFEIRAT